VTLAGASGTRAFTPLWPRPQRGAALVSSGCESLASSPTSLVLFLLANQLELTFEVLPKNTFLPVGSDRRLTPRVLHLVFEDALHRALTNCFGKWELEARASCFLPRQLVILSWGSQRPSLHRQTFQVSTPVLDLASESDFLGEELPRSTLVPSLSFCTTATAFSTWALQVCCALLPILGFTTFRMGSWCSPPPCMLDLEEVCRRLRRVPAQSSAI